MRFNPLRKAIPYLSLDNRVNIKGYKDVTLIGAIGMLKYPSESEFFSRASVSQASARLAYCFNVGIESVNRMREDICYEVYATYFEQHEAAAERFKNSELIECTDIEIGAALTRLHKELLSASSVPASNIAEFVDSLPEAETVEDTVIAEETISEDESTSEEQQVDTEVEVPEEPTTDDSLSKSAKYWEDKMGTETAEIIKQLKVFHTTELNIKLTNKLKSIIAGEFATVEQAMKDTNFHTALLNKFENIYPFIYYQIYVIGQRL